jgi:hypothetical protein
MTFETAPPETTEYEDASSASSVLYGADGPTVWIRTDSGAHGSLSAHMRRLRKQNQGISRWLGLAILVGSVVAVAFLNFFAR